MFIQKRQIQCETYQNCTYKYLNVCQKSLESKLGSENSRRNLNHHPRPLANNDVGGDKILNTSASSSQFPSGALKFSQTNPAGGGNSECSLKLTSFPALCSCLIVATLCLSALFRRSETPNAPSSQYISSRKILSSTKFSLEFSFNRSKHVSSSNSSSFVILNPILGSYVSFASLSKNSSKRGYEIQAVRACTIGTRVFGGGSGGTWRCASF